MTPITLRYYSDGIIISRFRAALSASTWNICRRHYTSSVNALNIGWIIARTKPCYRSWDYARMDTIEWPSVTPPWPRRDLYIADRNRRRCRRQTSINFVSFARSSCVFKRSPLSVVHQVRFCTVRASHWIGGWVRPTVNISPNKALLYSSLFTILW